MKLAVLLLIHPAARWCVGLYRHLVNLKFQLKIFFSFFLPLEGIVALALSLVQSRSPCSQFSAYFQIKNLNSVLLDRYSYIHN
jgi:hypothetical protein